MKERLILAASGSFAGAMASGTGLAGALVMIPTLNNATTLSSAVITGTTLCATTVLTTIGSINYIDQGLVDLPVALSLGAVGVSTSFLGAELARRVANVKKVERLMKPTLGAGLLLLAPYMYIRNNKNKQKTESETDDVIEGIARRRKTLGLTEYYRQQFKLEGGTNVSPGLLLTGSIGGFSQGFLALGGGILQTSFMTNSTEMNQNIIIATSIAATTIVNTFAASLYIRRKLVHLPSVAILGLSGGATLVGCSGIAMKMPEQDLKNVFVSFLTLSSCLMIRGGLKR